MILYGTTHRVGNGVTTDDIIAPDQRGAGDPALLAAYCLATLDPAIAEDAREGDVLLAGKDFGQGDDADTAVLGLQALGLAAIVCASADAGFVEAAAAYGLPVLTCPSALEIAAGTIVRLDLTGGTITDRSNGRIYRTAPCSRDLVDAVRRAQLLARMRRVVDEEGFDG